MWHKLLVNLQGCNIYIAYIISKVSIILITPTSSSSRLHQIRRLQHASTNDLLQNNTYNIPCILYSRWKCMARYFSTWIHKYHKQEHQAHVSWLYPKPIMSVVQFTMTIFFSNSNVCLWVCFWSENMRSYVCVFLVEFQRCNFLTIHVHFIKRIW